MAERHTPRKRFGQHFLRDRNIISNMVTQIAPEAGRKLLEIGPGEGALTDPLLAAGARMVVVEVDRDLAARLRARHDEAQVAVIESDVLKLDVAGVHASHFPDDSRIRVVGNLPYNISTPLLFHLLDAIDRIQDMHLMVQKEVAERLAALPGQSAYGRLGVMVGALAEVRSLFDVAPGCFHPPPKVRSAVVRVSPRAEPLVAPEHRTAFANIVRQAFSQRRKTVRRSLSQWFDAADFAACDIAPEERPERLGIPQFVALAERLNARD